MKYFLNLFIASTFLISQLAFGAGRLQNEDFKSLSELTAAGGTSAQLLNDTKIYITGGGINKQLSTAITNGDIGGGGGNSGKNYLQNAGFETFVPGSPGNFTGWTVAGAIPTADTSDFHAGSQSASLALSSAGSIVQDVTQLANLSGNNTEVGFWVKTSTSGGLVCPRINAVTLTGSSCNLIPSNNVWTYVFTNVVGPASGTSIGAAIVWTATSGTIKLDQAYDGGATNIGTVSAPQNFMNYSVTTNPGITDYTGTSYSSAVWSSAPVIAITGTGACTASTSTLSITCPSLGAGSYYLRASSEFRKAGSAVAGFASFRFYDGTNTYGEITAINSQAAEASQSTMLGKIVVAAPRSNVTISIQQKVDTTSSIARVFGNNVPQFLWDIVYIPDTSQQVVQMNLPTQPTYTDLTSGSGTFTVPAGATSLEIEMVGGGGGGGGGGTTGTVGGNGGTTTFGTSLLTANGGTGGVSSSLAAGGVGGTATIGAGALGTPLTGGQGGASVVDSASITLGGGAGGSNPLGGAGQSTPNGNGTAGATNTGSGGGGAGTTNTITSGAGGGAGGYIIGAINSLAASYSYAIGAGGIAGTGNVNQGGAGASGLIRIKVIYQGGNAPLVAGGVTSSSSGVERVERVSINGSATTPTFALSSSCFSSVSRSSTGVYIYGLVSGCFTSPPVCVCSNLSGSGSCSVNGFPTTSSLATVTQSNVGTNSDYNLNIICMGPK
jgi:hypothetical protein